MNLKPFITENTIDATELKVGQIGMHGDVIVEKCQEILGFENLKKCEDNILALGEHTGHAHKLFPATDEPTTIDVREDKDGVKYFKIDNVCFLRHQEHHPIKLPPGVYRTGIQKEYDHISEQTRQVLD